MRSILLVEDQEHIGELTARTLEKKMGMAVIWVKTLNQAKTVLNQKGREDFFAAVLDFVLPDAPNGEIIDLVVNQTIPSIVFTGSISEEIREFVWARKVVDYILKDDNQSLDNLVDVLKKLQANSKNKILIVDDSLFFRKIISDLLYIHHFKIIAAQSGEEALQALGAHPDIKLVITDFHMPGMDGCRLCREIRKTRPRGDLAIIGISTEGNAAMAAQFIKSGANDFIVKQSFILEEFYCRINQSIETIDLIRMTREAAIKDFLTGLYNRRYFFEKGEEIFQEAIKSQRLLACVMMDIDHFKQVNDTHGHDAGDAVLKALSAVLQDHCRDTDLLARLGGEEFCILVQLFDSGAAHPAREVKQRFDSLRKVIQELSIDINTPSPINITMSMGIGFNGTRDFEAMLKQADQRLYLAKEGGRNQVKVSDS